MKIVFAANRCLAFHAKSLDERPFGGTETGVIRLSEALLKLGHTVKVFTLEKNPPPSEPPYSHLENLAAEPECDVFVAVRDWQLLFSTIKTKRRFFLTPDSFDQPHNFGIGDRRVSDSMHALLVVSTWHGTTLAAKSGLSIEKVWVLRNGVHLPYFEGAETRARKRLIYSSTPHRGLALVPDLYRKVKEKHPDASLHIFAGLDVYAGAPNISVKEFDAMKAGLQALPDCTLHGNVLQKELAREFMKSSVLFYPNIFAETSCITAMEAQAAGCAIVTSNIAGLKETVGPAGILVPGSPSSPEYQQQFVEATNKLLSDDALFKKLSDEGRKRAKEIFDWNLVAKRFEAYLQEVHGLKS